MRSILALALTHNVLMSGIAFAKAETAAAPAPETEVESVVTEGGESEENEAPATDALVPLLDVDKVKSVRSNLGDRTYFVSDESGTAYDKAAAHLSKASEATSEFHGLPIEIQDGLETASSIIIATLGVRDKGGDGEKARNGYKAILVYSLPTVADFLADESEEAKSFVAKLIEREAADVSFQNLRGATSLSQLQTAFLGMPKTVGDIVTTSRESSGLDTDAFDAMWQAYRVGVLRQKAPKVEAALPQKPDIIKSIRSASYANANPKCKPLEENGLFVKIARQMIQLAPGFKDKKGEPMNLDMSTIEEWIAGRDTLNIAYSEAVVTKDDLAGIDF